MKPFKPRQVKAVEIRRKMQREGGLPNLTQSERQMVSAAYQDYQAKVKSENEVKLP